MLSLEDRAKNEAYRLTFNEEELVDYIKNNKEEVSQIKIITLAEIMTIAPNTITRFCYKLGYESFAELKLFLNYETRSDSYGDYQQILNKNFELIDKERELKAANIMYKARGVNFYAKDQTGLILKGSAQNFYAEDNKFQSFEYESDIIRRIKSAKNETFFLVSLTGESRSVVDIAKCAKVKGHKVISLTNLSDNTLSKLADVSLYCYTEVKHINDYNVTDKTPLMIIMYSLYLTYREI